MSGFSAVLAAHAARYPRMEARDWAKLAYQSQFGPAHLLDRDPAALQADLEAEWAAVDAPPPVPGPEDIGNGLCRFPLSPGADLTLAAPLLARLVLRTAREHRGTMAGLEAELAALEGRDIPGLADFLARWRREGCPPVHHSEAFRAAYRPHYRLIRLSYGGYFPALLALVRLIGSGRPAVAAPASSARYPFSVRAVLHFFKGGHQKFNNEKMIKEIQEIIDTTPFPIKNIGFYEKSGNFAIEGQVVRNTKKEAEAEYTIFKGKLLEILKRYYEKAKAIDRMKMYFTTIY